MCRISLADDDATLEGTLAKEFPWAEVSRDDGRLREWVGIVASIVCGDTPDAGAKLPLDVRGTAFQRRVWEALRQIPRGETRTYAEIADTIGQPRATRAVANACGKNPTPLVVPCHRVVRYGGVGGYALGTERKEALLKRRGYGRGVCRTLLSTLSRSTARSVTGCCARWWGRARSNWTTSFVNGWVA